MITFLLKEVDKGLWGLVKAYVFDHDLTIREFIIQAIEEKLDVKK